MGPDQYGITINPLGLSGVQASAYCLKVREDLKKVERTKSGKILLNSIRYYGRPVEIRPFPVGDCGPTAYADMEISPPDSIGGMFRALATAGQSQVKAFAYYSPDRYSKSHGCNQSTPMTSTTKMDEVLVHELAHVFRFVSGKLKIFDTVDTRVPLHSGLREYTNNEEFYATLLEHIYVSDRSNKTKSVVKTSYTNHWPLKEEFMKPWGFFAQSVLSFDLIDTFCQDHKGLSKRIATDLADSAFNPITDYYADKERARRVSQGAMHNDIAMLTKHMIWWLEDLRIIR